MNKKLLVGILATATIACSVGAIAGSTRMNNFIKASEYDLTHEVLTISANNIKTQEGKDGDDRYACVTTTHGNLIKFYGSRSLCWNGEDYLTELTASTGIYLQTGFQKIESVVVNFERISSSTGNLVLVYGTSTGDWTSNESRPLVSGEALIPTENEETCQFFNIWSFTNCRIQSIVVTYSCAY